MGLFDGLDIAGAPEVGVPDGVYKGVLQNVEMSKSKAGDDYLVWTWKVRGTNLQEWQACPQHPETWDNTVKDKNDMTEKDRNERSHGYIKLRLETLGVPTERMNTVDKTQLIGMEGIVTVRKNQQGYPSIVNIALPGNAGVTLPTGNVAQAAVTPAPAPVTAIPVTPATSGPVENPFASQ